MTSQEYVAGLFDLTGHVGIITGASRGLGLGQAKVLTDAGAKVYNFDIAPHSDEETIREGSLIDVIPISPGQRSSRRTDWIRSF